MAKYYINKNSNSFGVYANFTPKNLPIEWVELTEETYNEVQAKINEGYSFSFNGETFAFTYTKVEPTQEEINATLRAKREPLLEAFDKWEKAVLRGRETDSESVMAWYRNLLDLVESAFDNVPLRVQYYL